MSPGELAHLPAAVHHGITAAYSSTIDTVLLAAVPIAALGFLLTWLLPEVHLRRTIATAAAPAQAGVTATPSDVDLSVG